MIRHEELLVRLEDAERRMNEWIASGKSLEICSELADIFSLGALAESYRRALRSGDADALDSLNRRVRVLLLPKSSDDRLDAMVLFHCRNDLAVRLQQMYRCFADEMHFSTDPVNFSDGVLGLCIRRGDLLAWPYQYLKNETGVHRADGEQCAVYALPLPEDVSSESFQLEAFVHPDNHRIHKTASCVRASRGGLACESLGKSAFQNRSLALAALTARLDHPGQSTNLIRSYDFSGGTMKDFRLEKYFSVNDPLPLFESLLLAE